MESYCHLFPWERGLFGHLSILVVVDSDLLRSYFSVAALTQTLGLNPNGIHPSLCEKDVGRFLH